jgi:SpoVK/Ycf46/Vps4 family AAA+-type ATPase
MEIEACEDGAILFVDECESIFSKRGQDDKDYRSAVTTELLQRMNGFGVDGSRRILIGATNRPDKIDPAYLRHKRFSHLVHITPPDAEALQEIVHSKLSGIPCDVSEEDILYMFAVNSGADRYSAADVCGIIEEACRQAIEHLVANQSTQAIPLTREMFEKAFARKKPSITAEALKSYDDFGARVEELK